MLSFHWLFSNALPLAPTLPACRGILGLRNSTKARILHENWTGGEARPTRAERRSSPAFSLPLPLERLILPTPTGICAPVRGPVLLARATVEAQGPRLRSESRKPSGALRRASSHRLQTDAIHRFGKPYKSPWKQSECPKPRPLARRLLGPPLPDALRSAGRRMRSPGVAAGSNSKALPGGRGRAPCPRHCRCPRARARQRADEEPCGRADGACSGDP
jgi:hypothetical protein